jgi:hypothetical protein
MACCRQQGLRSIGRQRSFATGGCQAHRNGGACGCAGSSGCALAKVDVPNGRLRLGVVPGLHRCDVLCCVRQPQLCIRRLQTHTAEVTHAESVTCAEQLEWLLPVVTQDVALYLPGRQRPAPGGEALLGDQLKQLGGAGWPLPVTCSRPAHVLLSS